MRAGNDAPTGIIDGVHRHCTAVAIDISLLNADADRMLRADDMYTALQTIINDCNEVLNGGDMSGMTDQELFSSLKVTCANAILNLSAP